MKKVKNFEALKKCGFEEINDTRKWYCNGSYHFGVKEDGTMFSRGGYQRFSTEVIIEDISRQIIEMTKAGCFDEPIKTLSELGWKVRETGSNFIGYVKGEEIIGIDLWEKEFTKYKYISIINKLPLAVTLEETKAIMLESERLNEN